MGDEPLVFEAAGNFRADEGSCSLWIQPEFSGDDTACYCTFFGVERWGMLYKYLQHKTLTFGTAKPDRDLYYDCGGPSIADWRPGQWHHVVTTWSRLQDKRRIYVDGLLAADAPFPYHRVVEHGPLFIGAGCELYPGHTAQSALDEVAIWDVPLDATQVSELFVLGSAGKPLATRSLPPVDSAAPTNGPTATTDSVINPNQAIVAYGERQTLSLDGWWRIARADESIDDPLRQALMTIQVPGHFTSPGAIRGPDGQAVVFPDGQRPGTDWESAAYQCAFEAPAAWRDRPVLLALKGVDGWAEIFLNGYRVGSLSAWEDEDFPVGEILAPGSRNVLVVTLHRVGNHGACGIYASVSLKAVPDVYVRDVVVRPLVSTGRIGFSCDVWTAVPLGLDAEIVFDVVPVPSDPSPPRRFVHACRLVKPPAAGPGLYERTQRIEAEYEWSEARRWTFDEPFQYQVSTAIRVAGVERDRLPPQRFGYREVSLRGGDILLNGVPTHLRGHQLNMAWGNQGEWIKDVFEAGMNCIEMSGPANQDWDHSAPTRAEAFDDILDYADAHGLLTVSALPDGAVLKERLLDPAVAAHYTRRVDKFVRRYGNHASIGMWFMHFNLAGYPWYLAPQKIDGSYRPADTAWLTRERYALQAEGLARSLDPRPVYHHACGALGTIHNANCYIGPSSPLQERREWPSRWAETRRTPLITCEHGLWLVPYWYRPREFPLSHVYAGEPLFDELSAMMLGPRAYSMIKPDWVDTYALPPERASERLMTLVKSHDGYQEVKALLGRESLRAWRTYGVSGIIFNAIQWDFRGRDGVPLPVMRSLQRYFGARDCFVAGPAGDWPTVDHAYVSGETIRKQLVLLNDLGHAVDQTVRVVLQDAHGKNVWALDLDVTFKPGEPTFVPFECPVPMVHTRSACVLRVSGQNDGREWDAFPLQVFPQASPSGTAARVLLYDPTGESTVLLHQAGTQPQPLTRETDLGAASIVVVGRGGWDETFVALAQALNLEQAVAAGLTLVVLEQTANVAGLRLRERSSRRAFIVQPDHPLLAGLEDADFVNLRGTSEGIEAYPDAAPETETRWPERFFKWGNRNIVATYVARLPHRGPFVPLLRSGFDLAESPLLEAHIGAGRMLVCQVDIHGRYGRDPVATRLLDNLLKWALDKPSATPIWRLISLGQAEESQALERTVGRAYVGKTSPHPLLAGLTDGDFYAKEWRETTSIAARNGWTPIVAPGWIATKGDTVVCALEPDASGATRWAVKAQRVLSILKANAGIDAPAWSHPVTAPPDLYEESPWEDLPAYINW